MDEVTAMKRCIALAQNSIGYHHPNPKVGCIIVHNNKIIGEGFHHKYGL
jgi:diaminohydroxyphosphoribosylaminopyrimidine deaminase/5-amino-6-(5-phosphoribosylamino)uracil reductase